ncbi:MAG: hypothetical protein NTZ73_00420 [Candidatus Diapherotrites archaeon]|nr:hypothetical protein [Candidatus Diapherotrites archaeon]
MKKIANGLVVLVLAALIFIITTGCTQEQNGQGRPNGSRDGNFWGGPGDHNFPVPMDRNFPRGPMDGNFNFDRMKADLNLPSGATIIDIKKSLGLPEDATDIQVMDAFRQKTGDSFRNMNDKNWGG